MTYWILKTEPETFSFEDLQRDGTTWWDGVRNYQARNNLRLMKVGDEALIYHSVGPRAIVGLAKISQEARPDTTASEGDWVAVEVKFVSHLNQPVSLDVMKKDPRLASLSLVKQSRLSVCPVSAKEWQVLMELALQPKK